MPRAMSPNDSDPSKLLLRDVIRFQVKLWLEAARDLVLSPITLGAAVLDFVMIKQQPPRYFRQLLELGRRSEDWIDLWSMVDQGAKGEKVDALLSQVERVVRDPRVGAHQAKLLMRWAEMQLARQRRGVPVPPAVPGDDGVVSAEAPTPPDDRQQPHPGTIDAAQRTSAVMPPPPPSSEPPR